MEVHHNGSTGFDLYLVKLKEIFLNSLYWKLTNIWMLSELKDEKDIKLGKVNNPRLSLFPLSKNIFLSILIQTLWHFMTFYIYLKTFQLVFCVELQYCNGQFMINRLIYFMWQPFLSVAYCGSVLFIFCCNLTVSSQG